MGHSHILYNLTLRSKKVCYHSLIRSYCSYLLRIIFRTNVMKLSRSFFAQSPIISNLLFLVVLVSIHYLQPNACLAMEPNGPCYANQTSKDRQCDIGVARVPMTPSPSIGTNCRAPIIAFPIGRMSSFKQVEEAPLTKRPCGSAPLTHTRGNTYCVPRAENAAPYFAGNQCPKAPIIISYPPKQVWNNCK